MNQLNSTNATQRSVIALFLILMLSSPAVYADDPEIVVHECSCDVFDEQDVNAEIRGVVNQTVGLSWKPGDIVVMINGQDWGRMYITQVVFFLR